MKSYVIADVHGHFDAMMQAIERSPFDPDADLLINLGDIVDGGRQTRQCIRKIKSFKHVISIYGNHDHWCLEWMKTGAELPAWVHQGGYASMESYGFDFKSVPKSHIKFLQSSLPYYIDDSRNIYVHGGFNPDIPFVDNTIEKLTWDRDIIKYAREKKIPKYNKVFIGHTTTQAIDGGLTPVVLNNLVCCDTGGGWNGKLSIIDVDTLEYWQSDKQDPEAWVETCY